MLRSSGAQKLSDSGSEELGSSGDHELSCSRLRRSGAKAEAQGVQASGVKELRAQRAQVQRPWSSGVQDQD